jgi:hypothetical protein
MRLGSNPVYRQVASTLSKVRLTATSDRIKAQWKAAGGQSSRPKTTDEQIKAYLHPPGERTRTLAQAAKALRHDGFKVSNDRIRAIRNPANAQQQFQ